MCFSFLRIKRVDSGVSCVSFAGLCLQPTEDKTKSLEKIPKLMLEPESGFSAILVLCLLLQEYARSYKPILVFKVG